MNKSLTFNGERKEWLYLLRGRSESPFAPRNHNLVQVPGMDGAHVASTSVEMIRVDQPIGFTVENEEHEQQLLDELKSWLLTDEDVEIEFDNVPDKTYIGRVTGSISDYERPAPTLRKGTITFLCQSHKYGPEQEVGLTGQGTIIDVPGTAETKPIIEIDVLAPITFAMVSNGDEYMVVGKPAPVDVTPVDTRTLLFEERGSSLDTWTNSGTTVDGTADGQLSTDDDGITVPSYGADTNDWHGPALMKEVNPAQDFEIVMGLQGRTTEIEQTFRIEFYAFDENMNNLGKMGVLDNSSNVHTKVGEARVGPIDDDHYVISSQNYEQRHDFWFGMVRMRRVGKEFELYITRIDNSSDHVRSLQEVFPDEANNYGGRLKYVQIHIGKYSDTPRAYGPKINYIRAFELSEATVDQTPYIAKAGDKITFDHQTDDRKRSVLINGEPIAKGEMGASPFKLKPGENTLALLPDGDVDGRVRYRPAYK